MGLSAFERYIVYMSTHWLVRYLTVSCKYRVIKGMKRGFFNLIEQRTLYVILSQSKCYNALYR